MTLLEEALSAATLEELAQRELSQSKFVVESHMRFPTLAPVDSGQDGKTHVPRPVVFDSDSGWFTAEVILEPTDADDSSLDWVEGCTIRCAGPPVIGPDADEHWHGRVLSYRGSNRFLITSVFTPDAWPVEGEIVVIEQFNYGKAAVERLRLLVEKERNESDKSSNSAAWEIFRDRSSAQRALLKAGDSARSGLLIWGPAGTGKTRRLGEELSQRRLQGRRCLAVSCTNVSADEIFLAILKRDQESAEPGEILRFGHTRSSELQVGGKWDRFLDFQKEQSRVEQRSSAISVEIADLRRALKQFPTVEEEARFRARIRELKEERTRLWADWKLYKETALSRAKVVIGTVYFGISQHASLAESGPFDCLACDEASLINSLYLALLWSMGAQEVVLTGDFLQHRPFSSLDKALEKCAALYSQGRLDPGHWSLNVTDEDKERSIVFFGRNIFDLVGLRTVRDWRQFEGREGFDLLKDQWRLSPGLGEEVSRAFYGGILNQARTSACEDLSGVLRPGIHWYDPQPWGGSDPERAAQQIKLALEALRARSPRRLTISIVTSKRPEGQAWPKALARSHRHDELLSTFRIQGRTCDIVFFDPIFWGEVSLEFKDWIRRCWTVAMTRASHAVVLLGTEHQVWSETPFARPKAMWSLREELEIPGH